MTAPATEIGRARGEAPGPTLLLVGGIHGNEPAGVEACRRVMERVQARGLHAGEVVALAGNTAALAEGRRYLRRDLNRQWTRERVAAARGTRDPDAETAALQRLEGAIDGALARARGRVFVVDLHTTSAEGVPFGIVGPREEDRSFAERFGLTGVAGLQEMLEGTLTAYLAALGSVTLVVEGGQHRSAEAAANLEAAATLALSASGLVDLPEASAAHERLLAARGDLPPLIEVTVRHPAGPGFRMEPGFTNVQRTRVGTLLAREDGAEVRAPFDGYLLLPLYQPQGEDGFFYGQAPTAAL